MWSDNETAIDAINVQHVVGAVVDILNTPHLTPITIGVFGPWGIGKSSVAQMVRQALTPEKGKEKESTTLVVFFNGWRFEGYEDAKAALMSTILEEITKRRKLTVKARKLLKRLWRSVNIMQLVKVHASCSSTSSPPTLMALSRGMGHRGGLPCLSPARSARQTWPRRWSRARACPRARSVRRP